MSTKQLIRYECKCEAQTKGKPCGHVWTTRLDGIPKNCPNCLARISVWNKSEEEKGDDVTKA